MAVTLAALLKKKQEKVVDQAATSIKVMYSFAFADVAIEDLRERLYNLTDNLIEISQQGELNPQSIEEFANNVMVGSLYEGFDNRAITEEVLQVVDMVINKVIDTELSATEAAEDKAVNKELLASVIRAAKDVVNGHQRRKAARKTEK
jgi:hypothetical protein